MQTDQVHDSLGTAAREVLETMFFTTLEDRTPPPQWSGPAMVVTIDFTGRQSGRFQLQLLESYARILAANFSGAEDPAELNSETTSEVIREMANMVCGDTLSRLSPLAIFSLGEPRISRSSEAMAGQDHNRQQMRWLDSGEGLIGIQLEWEDAH